MIKSILSLFIVLFIFNLGLVAQELVPVQGNLETVQDDRITQLAEKYRKMSITNPKNEGYRVQIFFDSGSNSKNRAASAKGDFDATFPGINSYLSYKEPYYRVRVGNFRTVIEAVGFQKKIESNYPNAFPVKDNISF